jgi:phosphopantothenoylcysteine decarboxylase/phosphopantothenate--cysteine ligase
MLHGVRVVVGVAGREMSDRACDLVRTLRAQGAVVRVAPTRRAQAFVTPLLFETLAGTPCLLSLPDEDITRRAAGEHPDPAVVVVAPADPDVLAQMVAGVADEPLLALLRGFRGPVVVAPALTERAGSEPVLAEAVASLQGRGVVVVAPVAGAARASHAPDRGVRQGMAPIADIVEATIAAVVVPDLVGVRAVVTAGPTVEDIDPVRSITNRSSGRMGVAVARALALRGARVILVHGPLRQQAPRTPGLTSVAVRSAAEMAHATFAAVDGGCDVAVLSAAVADYTPAQVAAQKIKKDTGAPTLELVRTTDILASLGARAARPLLIGFAAETQRVEEAACEKRVRKRCALVVGNDVSGADANAGFDVDTNRVFIARDPAFGPSEWWPTLSKDEVAWRLAGEVRAILRPGDPTVR